MEDLVQDPTEHEERARAEAREREGLPPARPITEWPREADDEPGARGPGPGAPPG